MSRATRSFSSRGRVALVPSPFVAVADLQPELRWEPCQVPDCNAAQVRTDGECLRHVDEAHFARYLGRMAKGGALDARGLHVDADLLERVLAAAPRAEDGRPMLRRARFDGARFEADARLENLCFAREVSFDGASFDGDVSFAGSRFEGHSRFARCRFAGPAHFDDATFATQAWFGAAAFAAGATFERVVFSGPAWFARATFDSDVWFTEADFGADATFESTQFGCHAFFTRATFSGEATFTDAGFANEARYDGAAFKGKGGAPQEAVRQAVWSGAALAPWPKRLGAGLVDHAVPAAILAGAVVLAFGVKALKYDGALPVFLVLAAAGAVWFNGRNLVQQGHTGQTMGKRRFGLCLVRERDGFPVGPKASVGRYGLHLLDTAPVGLGWIRAARHPKRQTFADSILTTVVIMRGGWARVGSGEPVDDAPPAGAG